MFGRGTRFFFFAVILGVCSATAGFTAPDEEIDYSRYFTVPEREGTIVYVFYNNILDQSDSVQFGYALMYGLEFAAGKAKETDMLAVGIYFTNNKGKIYRMRKKDFYDFHQQKLAVGDLMKYMAVTEVDTSKSSLMGTKVN